MKLESKYKKLDCKLLWYAFFFKTTTIKKNPKKNNCKILSERKELLGKGHWNCLHMM